MHFSSCRGAFSGCQHSAKTSIPRILSDPLKEQKAQRREKNHNRQIVSEKEDARFGIVKKSKGKPQNHISRDLPLEECIDPVDGDSCKDVKDDGLFLLWQHRVQMGSGMETHQDKTPVRQRQMDGTGDRGNSISRQKGIQVLAHENPTQRLANHE